MSPAPGARIKGNETDFALRFHLHPAVKASRLSDARGVMLVLPNRDVWTFEALDDKVDLEDSVFLAGNDGPRRTAQIVIRQDSRHAPSIRWSFVRSTTSASATTARRKPAASRNCRCRTFRRAGTRSGRCERAESCYPALFARLATLDGAPSGSASYRRAPGHSTLNRGPCP